ncbi:MAG: DUF2080 family transposase-associated protein [Nanoarchaeota archaeon]
MAKKKTNKRIEITKKEIKINLEKLHKDVEKAYDTMRKILPEAILKNQEVRPFGNAAHIILPKEYINKKVTVIVKKD